MLGEWSETAFNAPKAFDGADDKGVLDTLAPYVKFTLSPVRESAKTAARVAVDPEPYRAMMDASERSSRLVSNSSWQAARLEDSFDNLAAKIKDATGVVLENPMMRNTSEIAGRIAKGEFMGWSDPKINELIASRQDNFLEQARGLKNQHPDKLAMLDLDTPIFQQGNAAAKKAEGDVADLWQRQGPDGLGMGAAMLAGGMYGSRRDPLFWASMMAGGEGVGASAAARIFSASAKQGAANAGFTALAQPSIQMGRAAAGLEYGAHEAVKDIGMSFLFGAVPGMAIGTMKELAGPASRVLKGAGTKADFDALDKAGVFVNDDTRAALKGAAAADEANAAILNVPDHVNPQTGRTTLAEGLARAEDPNAPLPLVDPPLPKGTTDDLARGMAAKSGYGPALVDVLRSDPRAIASALASPEPHLRDMGRIASLGDEALAMVKAGEIAPEHGAVIAAMSQNPADHAAMAAVLKEAKPETVAEARIVLSDKIAADNAIAAAEARVGALEIGPSRPRGAGEMSLLEFLSYKGGLRANSTLSQIFDGNPFVPRFGRLVRQDGGMSLDVALRTARDAGYLFDAGHVGPGELQLGINHLLEKLDDEARGQKVWPVGVQDRHNTGINEATRRWDVENATRLAESRKAMRAEIGDIVHEFDDDLVLSASHLVEGGHVKTWDDALERAAIMDYHREAARQAFERDVMQGYGFDGKDIARAEPFHEIPFDGPPGVAGRASPDGARLSEMGGAATPEPRPIDGAGGQPRNAGGAAGKADGGAKLAASNDVLDLVPIQRADGTTALLSRDELNLVSARERKLSFAVDTCMM